MKQLINTARTLCALTLLLPLLTYGVEPSVAPPQNTESSCNNNDAASSFNKLTEYLTKIEDDLMCVNHLKRSADADSEPFCSCLGEHVKNKEVPPIDKEFIEILHKQTEERKIVEDIKSVRKALLDINDSLTRVRMAESLGRKAKCTPRQQLRKIAKTLKKYPDGIAQTYLDLKTRGELYLDKNSENFKYFFNHFPSNNDSIVDQLRLTLVSSDFSSATAQMVINMLRTDAVGNPRTRAEMKNAFFDFANTFNWPNDVRVDIPGGKVINANGKSALMDHLDNLIDEKDAEKRKNIFLETAGFDRESLDNSCDSLDKNLNLLIKNLNGQNKAGSDYIKNRINDNPIFLLLPLKKMHQDGKNIGNREMIESAMLQCVLSGQNYGFFPDDLLDNLKLAHPELFTLEKRHVADFLKVTANNNEQGRSVYYQKLQDNLQKMQDNLKKELSEIETEEKVLNDKVEQGRDVAKQIGKIDEKTGEITLDFSKKVTYKDRMGRTRVHEFTKDIIDATKRATPISFNDAKNDVGHTIAVAPPERKIEVAPQSIPQRVANPTMSAPVATFEHFATDNYHSKYRAQAAREPVVDQPATSNAENRLIDMYEKRLQAMEKMQEQHNKSTARVSNVQSANTKMTSDQKADRYRQNKSNDEIQKLKEQIAAMKKEQEQKEKEQKIVKNEQAPAPKEQIVPEATGLITNKNERDISRAENSKAAPVAQQQSMGSNVAQTSVAPSTPSSTNTHAQEIAPTQHISAPNFNSTQSARDIDANFTLTKDSSEFTGQNVIPLSQFKSNDAEYLKTLYEKTNGDPIFIATTGSDGVEKYVKLEAQVMPDGSIKYSKTEVPQSKKAIKKDQKKVKVNELPAQPAKRVKVKDLKNLLKESKS